MALCPNRGRAIGGVILTVFLSGALLFAAGCGGSKPADETPETQSPFNSSGKSTTPPPSGKKSEAPKSGYPEGVPTELPKPPANQANTKASAQEYAVFALETMRYSIATASMAPLELILTNKQCNGCGYTRKFIKEERREGYFQVPDGKSTITKTLYLGKKKRQQQVLLLFKSGPIADIAASGRKGKTYPSQDNASFEATLIWEGTQNRWRLVNYVLDWDNES